MEFRLQIGCCASALGPALVSVHRAKIPASLEPLGTPLEPFRALQPWNRLFDEIAEMISQIDRNLTIMHVEQPVGMPVAVV